MKAISQFVVKVADLLEAEGRAFGAVLRAEAHRAHNAATNMAMAATFLVIAAPLVIAGLGLIGAGLMWWLEPMWGRALAAAVTGCALLAFGAASIWCFGLAVRRTGS